VNTKPSQLIVLALTLSLSLRAVSGTPVHGLWVWKGPAMLHDRGAVDRLAEFCRDNDINEVYLAVSSHGVMMPDDRAVEVISTLHGDLVRVEALLSSDNADEAGPHREKLLRQVGDIVQFNRRSPHHRFDGIHLDIEPQQRAENKGGGNLRFLPGLVETYRAARAQAEAAGLGVNADIQNKLLKGTLAERRMLLGALPRLTLMMYEVSAPGEDEAAQLSGVKLASRKFLDMAYAGIDGASWARMVIGLRTPDYGHELPVMLRALEAANASDPHFLGWARHAYNDQLDLQGSQPQ
jgi:hypothetical protein